MTMIDAAELSRALQVLVAGFPFEVRVLGGFDRIGGKPMTFSGYFDDVAAVAPALGRMRGWHGVYVTPNPVDSALLHRCHNRIELAARNSTTTDANVTRRRWLLLDFDPVTFGDNGPIKGIAATDAEKSAAHALALHVRDELSRRGWPDPVLADSGNGYHLDYRIELPAASDLPKRLLDALSARFDDDAAGRVLIDTSVANPARIWKLYGTLACKGAGVGDRPHRMARIIDAPLDPQPVDVALIEAFVAEVLPVAEPAPAAPAAPRAGVAPSADFDAVRLVEAAGLSLGSPKVRSGGDTVREFQGSCPCGKLRGGEARGSYLVVAKSGAVGLGCRHASCEHSDTNRKPGESWREWRKVNDPNYAPDGAGAAGAAAVAAAVERGGSVAERLRKAAPDGVDLSGMVPDGVTAHEPEPVGAQVQPRARDADDRRPVIDVCRDHADVRRDVLQVLQRDPSLYLAQGEFARVGDGYRMVSLAGGALDAFVAQRCRFVEFKRDRETGVFVPRPRPLPDRVLTMLQALLPEDFAAFRDVVQVTRAPVFTASGRLVATPGYDGEARTLLVECPQVERRRFPDGSFAIDRLREIVGDFPFEGGVRGPEFANWLGALLAPMVRPMIHGPMPMLLIEANRQGSGKTLLAQLVQVIYGLPAEVGPMQKDEGAFAKQLLSILREAKPVHIFDNVKHAVVSTSLDMVLTSETYTDRVLQESRSLHLAVLTLWIMTSNNARLSADMVRRVIRCRLVTPEERPEERTDIAIPDLLGWARANRGEILSAMVQIVDEWLAAGAPLAAHLPRLGSFESFSSVIGSILAFHGERQWLNNLRDAKEATAVEDEWEPFLIAWHRELAPFGPVKAKALHDLAVKHDLLSGLLSHGSDLSQMTRIASALRSKKDQVLYGFVITSSKDGHTGQTVYSCQRKPVARMA